MDQSGPGGPRGPQPPLVDEERSGPAWTTLQYFPDAPSPSLSLNSPNYGTLRPLKEPKPPTGPSFSPKHTPKTAGQPHNSSLLERL